MTLLTLAVSLALSAAAHQPLQPQEAVDRTLTAMADGHLAGEPLVAYIRGSRLDVRPMLDGKAPPLPRALAPRIADVGMTAWLRDMPESAEKEYMRRSMMARVWLDLGGDVKMLPAVDPSGWSDREFATAINPWLENSAQMALRKIGEDSGKKPLEELDLSAAEYDRANKDFVAFLALESEWRQRHPRKETP